MKVGKITEWSFSSVLVSKVKESKIVYNHFNKVCFRFGGKHNKKEEAVFVVP